MFDLRNIICAATFLLLCGAGATWAADQPQWGENFSRNMVSGEKDLPDSFDPATGRNIKWSVELGTQCHDTPIVTGGRVLIGTNNDKPRDPRHQGDRAVLLCLDEKDGHLLWQLVVPKISEDDHDKYLDWPKTGFSSPPTVEGDRAYTLTNRGEVICLDMKGMSNGNDGPYVDEARHAVPRGNSPIEPKATDGDILWLNDLVQTAGVHIHDQVHGSPLLLGDLLYINSCNGVDNTHRKIRSPDAPSLVVLDKHTGKIVARDDQHIGPNIFHCLWSSPSLGVVNGQPAILFGSGDGVCYAFEPLKEIPKDGTVATLKTLWKFDSDPAAPKENVHQYVSNRVISPSIIYGMPVFHQDRVFFTSGGDLWWGKRDGALKCIGANGTGDVTSGGGIWTYPLGRETGCTPAISDGLIFVTDCGGILHCVDAETGKPHWTQKCIGDFWASPLVADGKVYVGTRKGNFVVMAASKEKKVLSNIELGSGISGTVTAANGRLYIATQTRLFCVGK